MTENQNVKNRLISFIKYLGIGQGKFEKECGLGNGYVNNIRVSITPNKLQSISLHYPELNQAWLLTGEGEMLKGVQTATENSAPVYQNSGNGGNNVTQTAGAPSSTIDKLIEEMRAQREMSAQQIERLLTIIENMTKPNKNNTNE